MIHLPPDFKEFLRLLNSLGVEYLVVGGYALGYHGYPRATGDMDVWVAMRPDNASRIIAALREFGFSSTPMTQEMFLTPRQVVRMGRPPLCIELLTTISGVDFAECYARRVTDSVDSVDVNFISLQDLKTNKRAAGRAKDLGDLEGLS